MPKCLIEDKVATIPDFDIIFEFDDWLKTQGAEVSDFSETFIDRLVNLTNRELTKGEIFVILLGEGFIRYTEGKRREASMDQPTTIKTWYEGAFNLNEVSSMSQVEIDKTLENPLSLEDVRNLSATILSISDLQDHWNTIIADTQYVGFDARQIASILWAISQKNNDGQDGQNPFYAEMAFLIVLFLQRGTSVIDKTKLGTVKKETRAKIAYLKKKYGILAKMGSEHKNSTITLSRIAACFPLICCKIMVEATEISRPVSAEAIQVKYVGYPAFLRNSCFFSIFYEDGPHEGILKALLYYQYCEGKVINQKNADYKKKSKEEMMEDVIKYASASFRSDLVPLDKRRKLSATYFSKITSTMQRAWAEKYDAEFPAGAVNVKAFFMQKDE